MSDLLWRISVSMVVGGTFLIGVIYFARAYLTWRELNDEA